MQSPRTPSFPSLDTVYLSQKGLADVRILNITRLVGSGILHTKMWLVDGKHFYVGSANQDWRALTQVWCNLCTIFNAWSNSSQLGCCMPGKGQTPNEKVGDACCLTQGLNQGFCSGPT